MKKKEEREKLVKVTISLRLKPEEKKLLEWYAKECTLRSFEFGGDLLYTREDILGLCVEYALDAAVAQRSMNKVIEQLLSLVGWPFHTATNK